MKIVFLSDTHNVHPYPDLPDGDMLIHCGDISNVGKLSECREVLDWFSSQPHKHKIFIAGNHDFIFEQDFEAIKPYIPDHVIYLNDSGVEIEGIKIWGSPVQPFFYNWAFNRLNEEIQPHWDLIPLDTNILITHGPTHLILDQCRDGFNAGCPRLLAKVKELKDLRIHACGHIHEAYGEEIKDGVHFINACILDHRYRPMNYPIEVDY